MGSCCSSSNTDLIEYLTTSPFFCLENPSNLSDLSSLSDRFIKTNYSANQILWEKGTTLTTFNIIIQGRRYRLKILCININRKIAKIYIHQKHIKYI